MVSPNLEEEGGIFLDSEKVVVMDFEEVKGKSLYKSCVKCFNKKNIKWKN